MMNNSEVNNKWGYVAYIEPWVAR